jgi:hypothetical protein
VCDGIQFHKKFNIVSLPTILVIDPQGKVAKYFKSNENIELTNIIK